MITPKVNNYTVGRGEVKIAKFAPGTLNPVGFRYIGNNPAFSLNVTTQSLPHYNMDHGVAEQDMAVDTQTQRNATFSTDNIDRDNLAMMFLGTALVATATSETGVTETLTDVMPGLTYQLGMAPARPYGRRKLTNVVVKIATVTKAPVTDYIVDLDRGTIYVVPATDGGTIPGDGTADLIVSYDQVASSVDQVISGNSVFEGAVRFDADNPTGKNLDYYMPYVRITPSGEFSLKAENAFQIMSFSMNILKKPGAAAFYVNGQAY